jgi:anti-sigma factor RsiW
MRGSRWRRVNAPRDHRWARHRLPAFLDGELPSRQRRRLDQHRALCPHCRRVLRTLDALLGVLPELRVNEDEALGVAKRTLAVVGARLAQGK